MVKAQVFFISKRTLLVLMLLTINSACHTQTNIPTTAPELQQLRITNSSNVDIAGLVVLFPGPTWDSEASRVEFGNISAGQTSEYRDIPSGVYNYAGYEYILDGHTIGQSVMDWVGESPMEGKKFTYQIIFDPKKVEGDQVQLITVLVDEP